MMIKLKDILSEALPDVPKTIGFHPTEDYKKQIPAEFRRFYNIVDGNKSGRFFEMANKLMELYGDLNTFAAQQKIDNLQSELEVIDDTSSKIQSYLAPGPDQESPYSIQEPRNEAAHQEMWKLMDDIHEQVNEIINNSTFDKWSIETTTKELNKLQEILEMTLNIFTGNYKDPPPIQRSGF